MKNSLKIKSRNSPLDCMANDEVSIYVDLNKNCLKGMNANLFVSKNSESVKYIGNGIALVNRDDLFKSSEPTKT